MLILNATTKVKSVMTDRGDMIQIMPGEVSRVIIASRNIVLSAMDLGSPSEVGIIISGSYEMDIAKSITGVVPYLYTDEAEAKSKLIDPSIEYKGNLNSSKVNLQNETIIKAKDKEIEALELKLKETKEELTAALKSDQFKEDLESRIEDLSRILKTTSTERDRLASQMKDLEDQVETMTPKLAELRKENGTKIQDLAGANEMINTLSVELNELKAQLDSDIVKDLEEAVKKLEEKEVTISELNSKVESLEEDLLKALNSSEAKEVQIKEYSSSLKESTDLIDSMKDDFNTACMKFNITKDDNGEWIQAD